MSKTPIPYLLILAILLLLNSAVSAQSGSEYHIGGGNNDYPTMSSLIASVDLDAGDVVKIYPGVYSDGWELSGADGTKQNPITIMGVDSAGNPITSPQETVVFDYSGAPGPYPVMLRDTSSWLIIQGLAFRNQPHEMDVIRVWSGGTVTFRYILFKDNFGTVSGKGGNDKLVIEYSEFDGGHGSHALYSVGSKHLVVQHCYFHDFTSLYHAIIKSRDWESDILYNYIEMGAGQVAVDACNYGNPSKAGFPGYQDTRVIGNIMIKDHPDWTRSFIHFATDSDNPRPGNLYVIGNTLVDLAGSVNGAFSVNTGGGYTHEIRNNILYGLSDMNFYDQTLSGENNWIQQGMAGTSQFTNSVSGTDPGFASLQGWDFHLSSGSSCRDAGTNSVSIAPAYEYLDVTTANPRSIVNGVMDIGAYEYTIDNTYAVNKPGGGVRNYPTMSSLLASVSLVPGDIVNIYPGVYTDEWSIDSAGSSSNRIIIRGVNSQGSPITSPQETVIFDLSGSTSDVPYEIKSGADYITLQGLCFRNWNYDGSRLVKNRGDDTILRHILFKDNHHTVFGSWPESSGSTIEFSEFSGGGFETRTGQDPSHQIYSESAGTLTIQHCYFHDFDSPDHALIKSRDWETRVLYNYIEMGSAQVGIDACQSGGNGAAPGGNQKTEVVGNIFLKSDNPLGREHSRSFIHHADDNWGDRSGDLVVVNNAFIDEPGDFADSGNGFFSVNTGSGFSNTFSNNILYSSGNSIRLMYDDSRLTEDIAGNKNWVKSGVMSYRNGLSNSVSGSNPGFLDMAGHDFHLSGSSQCVDTGDNSAVTLPQFQYVGPSVSQVRSIVNGIIDIGAYEHVGGLPDTTPPDITGISALNIGSNSALISWQTDEPADSRVDYGLTTSYGSSSSDLSLRTSHSIQLSGLTPDTTYHYKVTSTDSSGNGRGSGDFSFTTASQSSQTDLILIAPGDGWTYLKGTASPPAGWNGQGFDDSGWFSGPTGIGYGDSDDATVLSDMRYSYLTVYTRRDFSISSQNGILQMDLLMDYDDGFVAYLNGQEVARAYMPSGTPDYNTETVDYKEPGLVETFDLSPHIGSLQPGANTLAVEMHNYNLESSDLTFIPELRITVDPGQYCHRADIGCDGCIDNNEIIWFIGDWKQGLKGITMTELMDGIRIWNEGGSGCP
jgi:hypothetical protein